MRRPAPHPGLWDCGVLGPPPGLSLEVAAGGGRETQWGACASLSQGIADYITRCRQALGKFESLVHQIHKNADDITSRLALMESVNLFKCLAPKGEDELPGGAASCSPPGIGSRARFDSHSGIQPNKREPGVVV